LSVRPSVLPSVLPSVRHSVRPEKFVSRVSLKAFDIQTWNFLNVLLRVGTCAPGYFHPAKIYIYGVMALDLVKKRHFKFVSRVSLKAFDIQTWNFLNVLLRVGTCAPGYFHPAKIYIYGVMALDLVKKRHFKFVSRVSLKAFDIQTWNFLNVLLGVWTCAPGYFHLNKIYIYRIMGLDLVKKRHF
jgi:uncharacterized membrane-anchored protein YitT (DUF2179 family)